MPDASSEPDARDGAETPRSPDILKTLEALALRVAALEERVAGTAGGGGAPSESGGGTVPSGLDALLEGDLAAHLADVAAWAFRYVSRSKDKIDKARNRVLLSLVVTPLSGAEAQLNTLGELLAESPDRLATLAAAAGHPARIRVLSLLAESGRSAHELGTALGLTGGPLHHHLHDLLHAGLIYRPERSRYEITPDGIRLFLSLAAMVHRRKGEKNE